MASWLLGAPAVCACCSRAPPPLVVLLQVCGGGGWQHGALLAHQAHAPQELACAVAADAVPGAVGGEACRPAAACWFECRGGGGLPTHPCAWGLHPHTRAGVLVRWAAPLRALPAAERGAGGPARAHRVGAAQPGCARGGGEGGWEREQQAVARGGDGPDVARSRSRCWRRAPRPILPQPLPRRWCVPRSSTRTTT